MVKRITENGNHVCFGLEVEDNYIVNADSGYKIPLKPTGTGSYIMEVSFNKGGSTQITVDSGAEENVCPWGWGEQFGTSPLDKVMKFRGAGGTPITHYGKRQVKVRCPF